MKSIYTLIPDIQKLVERKDGWFTDELAKLLSEDIASRLKEKFNQPEKTPTLRLSQMGPKCPCALWHSIHSSGEAAPLPAWAEIKFAFGHILEALAVTLARASGHEVTGEQDAVYVDGITGHRDAVVDGCVVDFKSASSLAYKKFKERTIQSDDPFGYLEQLDGYLVGSADDPLVRIKDRAYIVAIDKTLGHMCLYEHHLRKDHIHKRIRESKEVVGRSTPPECTCKTVEDGKSGNLKLDVKASYSAQRYLCKPNLRTFHYASGPVYLTKVVRKPDVREVDKNGNSVYA